jgi:hypothetical protein
MKNILPFLVLAIALVSCEKEEENSPAVEVNNAVELTMGPGYINTIYIDIETKKTNEQLRTSWDIAFKTAKQSASIFINDGSNVKLYAYPNGTIDDWATVDTSGLSTWNVLYNDYSAENWEEGAFSRNALGHPDYGWGTYNMSNHTVTGDSIFIIQLVDGSYRKLMVEQRPSTDNSYHIKYADLNGDNEKTAVVSTRNYDTKAFIYYSLLQNTVVDMEPVKEDWDLVFTKYMAMVYMGPTPVPYPVTGVLSKDLEIVKAEAETTDYASLDYSKVISSIGSDWKKFNMETYQYEVDTVSVFYLKKDDNYYSLRFTAFDMETGNVSFDLIKK